MESCARASLPYAAGVEMSVEKTADGGRTFLKTLQGAEQAFLAGRRRKQADVESAVAIFLEFLSGFELFDVPDPCVTVFGSSRIADGHPHYRMARDLGQGLARAGYSVITGGGPGLMEAANRGAKEAGGFSMGCSIALPAEQVRNAWLDSFVHFEHFFVRKVMLVKYSRAFVVLPGGFGTVDEAFEIATLIQTGKLTRFPIVAMGVDFWEPVRQLLRDTMVPQGLIDEEDLGLVKLTDDVAEAVEWIRSGSAPQVSYP